MVDQSDWLPMTMAIRGGAEAGLITTLRKVVALERGEVVVELVDDGLAGRDLEAGDVGVGDAREVLHQRAERIAVSGDEHGLAGAQGRGDRGLVIGQDAGDGVLEALGRRNGDPGVARIAGEIERAARFQHRRRGVEAAAPDLHLVLAVLGRRLGLVQPGKPAVVTLVQAPVLGFGNPHAACRLEREVERADRTGLHGGEGERRKHALLAQQRAGSPCFGLALLSEIDIPPAGKTVLEVPLALAMADEDQARHWARLPAGLEFMDPREGARGERLPLAAGRGFGKGFARFVRRPAAERSGLCLAPPQVLPELRGEPLLAGQFALFGHSKGCAAGTVRRQGWHWSEAGREEGGGASAG
jgi:hypothetical protein